MRALLLVPLVASLAGAAAGCGDDHADPSLPGHGSSLADPDRDETGAAEEGEPCDGGETEDCRLAIDDAGEIPSCIDGVRTCRGGAWGPCEGGLVAADERAPAGALDDRFGGGIPRGAAPRSQSCEDACDPDCAIFPDVIAGSATPASSPQAEATLGGDRLSFEQNVPGPFQQRLLKSPCGGSAGSCQTDTFCEDGVCTPYEEDETRTVGGADLTVGIPCGSGADARIPVCNRGDAPSATGVKLAFLSSNSNQLQNDLASCTLASNRSFSHECTIPEAIQPGTCVMAPPSCNAGLAGNNRALVVNPRRAAPNTVTPKAEAAGACGNNWSWWDKAVVCSACAPAVETRAIARSGGACAPITLGTVPSSLLTQRVATAQVRTSSSAPWGDLTRVQEADGCSGGKEYWIDESGASAVAHLCPATCDAVAGASAPSLRVTVACPVTFEPSLSGRILLEGSCPPATRTHWRWLSYNALVPGDASLRIEVRSGETPAIDAPFVEVANVDATDDLLDGGILDTAACLFTDPDPECPVSLGDELGGAPGATNPFLELRWTLTRSSNTRLAPQLHSIETTFTCPDTE